MIAFNFNIHFQDESSLDDGIYDTDKENIYILKSIDSNAFSELSLKSDYIPMSDREVCYGAEKAYAECKEGCIWGVDVKGLVSFVWHCGERSLIYTPQKEFTPQLLQFWVLHTMLPLMLSLDENYNILHVGAVEVAGHPILFSAESFGGKSTITDYFLKQGHTLLSDDTLGIYEEQGTFMAVASYPFHRPYRETESLGYKVTKVMKNPKPLKAVYLLEKSEPDAVVVIEELKGIAKYKAFHFSTFINFDFLKEQRFRTLSAMADRIPVYKITLPWDLERLSEIHEKIVHNSSL